MCTHSWKRWPAGCWSTRTACLRLRAWLHVGALSHPCYNAETVGAAFVSSVDRDKICPLLTPAAPQSVSVQVAHQVGHAAQHQTSKNPRWCCWAEEVRRGAISFEGVVSSPSVLSTSRLLSTFGCPVTAAVTLHEAAFPSTASRSHATTIERSSPSRQPDANRGEKAESNRSTGPGGTGPFSSLSRSRTGEAKNLPPYTQKIPSSTWQAPIRITWHQTQLKSSVDQALNKSGKVRSDS